MSTSLREHLGRLADRDALPTLRGIRRGIEKESLRVDGDGILAVTDHPVSLGSALTHPYITTDYSEALLELRTPAQTSIDASMDLLSALHRFVYQRLDGERLWVCSMPCVLRGEESIRIAEYGRSNVAMMKHVYRRGLGYRYGRMMQVIAGIHYNFSLPDTFWSALAGRPLEGEELTHYRTDGYFAMVRNFHRYCWLVLVLTGASPAVCRTFVEDRDHGLQEFDRSTLFLPHATTLRMGDLGYKNDARSGLQVCYNSLDEFITGIERATRTPHAAYEAIGVQVDGEWRQLNANVLQIENEYYAVVRPKQVARSGERPTRALRRRGIEYVEVRCIDLDPFVPEGMDPDLARFLDVFLLYCLLSENPPVDDCECDAISRNQDTAVKRGRDRDARLLREGRETGLREWACELLDAMRPAARALDSAHGGTLFAAALAARRAMIDDLDTTPSARMLREMREGGESFFRFGLRRALETERHFQQVTVDSRFLQELEASVPQSLQEQARIEASEAIGFEEHLARYYAQD